MAVVMKYINLISRCAELYRAEKLGTLGLAPHHHTYVVHISREPGVSPEELCRSARRFPTGAYHSIQ